MLCLLQLTSVSRLFMLGETDARVRYLFYAILCIGRNFSYGSILLNSSADLVGGSCFVTCCRSFSTSTTRFLFIYRSVLNYFLHSLSTLCADCLTSSQSQNDRMVCVRKDFKHHPACTVCTQYVSAT